MDKHLDLIRAIQSSNVEMVSILLESEASKWLNNYDDIAFTPLMWAAKNNNLDIVKMLLKASADVNIHDEQRIGNTVLREVIDTCSYEMVQTLVEAGADPTIPGWMQLTALDKAVERLENDNNAENREILDLIHRTINKGA